MIFIEKLVKHFRLSIMALFLMIILIGFIEVFLSIPEDRYGHSNDVRELNSGWYYLDANGNRVDITLPTDIRYGGSELLVKNDSLTDENVGEAIIVKGIDRYYAQITDGDNTLYAYREQFFKRSTHNRSSSFVIAALGPHIVGDLTFHLSGSTDGFYHLDSVYIGSGTAVDMYMVRDSLPTFIITISLMGFGLVLIMIYFVAHLMGFREARFIHVAFLLIFYDTWNLFNSSYFYSMQNSFPYVSLLTHISLALIPLPVLLYARSTIREKSPWVIDISLFLVLFNSAAQLFLQLNHVAEFSSMLIFTHICIFLAAVVSTEEMLRSFFRTHERNIFISLLGFSVVYIAGVVSLVLYWLVPSFHFEYLFDLSLFTLFLILTVNVTTNMTSSMKYRTEVDVFRHLAGEDALTGLKNRRGLEADLQKMVPSLKKSDDIALIYMDVNNLKETNDKNGHEAGDRLLITVSNCLRNTFGDNCYRLGGDEFCAILLNPEDLQSNWYVKMDSEVAKGQGRFSFSIARGFSMLRRNDGTIKTMREWEGEADKMMYANKRAMKMEPPIYETGDLQ